MTVKLAVSEICSALYPPTIGSKVINRQKFFALAEEAIAKHDFLYDRVPGQGAIECPELVPFVSAGVGRRSDNPNHYVCREHRGVVSAYLKREYAEKATGCNLVAYSKEAYCNDPDTTKDEKHRIDTEGATHVIVAVLAYAGAASPLPPYRLVWNLAGGNREALVWSADEIRTKAKAAIEYESRWSVVAD